jgi:outer membrane protein assembly factor BamA
VIRRRLLFKEGDPYSRRILEESERLLRSFGFLYDARIHPVGYEGGRVEVEVETRDVWTLKAGVNLGRKGGVNRFQVGIEETNLLGFGKSLSVQHSKDVDRVSQIYAYGDPGLLGSRAQMTLSYANNSDGQARSASVERPFFALDTRWAAGISSYRNDRVDPLYDLGHATARFRHMTDTISAYAGFSRGLMDARAQRLSAGFTFDRHTFGLAPGEVPPPSFPVNRTLSYPWIAFDSVQDGFITAHDLDKIQRTEDLNLAHEGHALLGWAAPAFGSDLGRAIFEGSYGIGLAPRPGRMMLMSGILSGRRSSDGFENTVAGFGTRYFVRDFGRHLFYASFRADMAYRLDREKQLLLGGDNGLRGYPLRYQDGDRRILLTVEQRFYTDWHVLKLFRVGGAVFFDAGRAWFAGAPDRRDLGVLKDAGLGLRLASSRSAKAAMAHVDVAFPMDGDPTIRRVQFLVSTHETF